MTPWKLLLLTLLTSSAHAAGVNLLGDLDLDLDGFTRRDGDCNDEDPVSWPGARELCFDGLDQDCNGAPDDACMAVNYEQIRLRPSAGTNHFLVPYLDDAEEVLPFLTPTLMVEHNDDQCDFKTTMTDVGGAVDFAVTVEHCGTSGGRLTYGFEAWAVVLSRNGGPGAFTYVDVDTRTNNLPNGTDTGSALLNGQPTLTFCTVNSADGNGDVDMSWACAASRNGDRLEASLKEGYGNGASMAAARAVSIELGDNLRGQLVPFDVVDNAPQTLQVAVRGDLGSDHRAFVVPSSWGTQAEDNRSFESTCTWSAPNWTCSLTCRESNKHILGHILLLEGSFGP